MNLDGIHNYYENLVFDEVNRFQADKEKPYSTDALEDVLCVALNNLPPRYARHGVDFAYFLTNEERDDMDKKVSKAVKDAFKLVHKNPTRG